MYVYAGVTLTATSSKGEFASAVKVLCTTRRRLFELPYTKALEVLSESSPSHLLFGNRKLFGKQALRTNRGTLPRDPF